MKELVHLAEFQRILEDPQHPYQPSEANQNIVRSTDMVLFVGPTNAGRNTMIEQLMPDGDYYFIVSDTTREPKERNGKLETDGVEYWFRDEEAFLKELRDGGYVEAAIIHDTQVSGMSIREIAKAKKQGKIAITDLEVEGVSNARAIKPDIMCLFVLPGNFDKWAARINKRGDLMGLELVNRLETATEELQTAIDSPFYWFIINDVLDEAVDYARELIKTRQPDATKQAAGLQLAKTLLQQTKDYLESL